MQKVKFALIGCGSIVKKHAESIKQIKDAELIAVCDKNPVAAKNIGDKYGVPYFTDAHEMAKKTEFDVFSILVPSGLHAEVVMDLMKYKKHFLIEKPIALRIEDADNIIKKCSENGKNIFVVQQNRFNLPIVKLKEAIDKGRMGKLVLGTIRVRWCRTQDYYDKAPWRGTWAFDGGVFTNQASHHIDMLVWMMGEVKSVMAFTSTRLVKIETEDTGVAIVKFKNGALGVIEATTATRPKDIEGSLSVLGENGSVEIGGFFMNELKIWNFSKPEPSDEKIFSEYGKNPDSFAWNHLQYIKNATESILKGKKGLVDGIEGKKSLELINALYESSETGKEVFIDSMSKKSKLGVR